MISDQLIREMTDTRNNELSGPPHASDKSVLFM